MSNGRETDESSIGRSGSAGTRAWSYAPFIFAYFASPVKVIDHNGRIWIGNFTSNPFEFDTTERAGPAISSNATWRDHEH